MVVSRKQRIVMNGSPARAQAGHAPADPVTQEGPSSAASVAAPVSNRALSQVLSGAIPMAGPVMAQVLLTALPGGDSIGNTAVQGLLAAGRIPDDELLSLLGSQPSLSAGVVDLFHFAGLQDMERSHPKSYALVRDRMVARAGAAKVAGLYANDARISRLLAWNTAVADKLTEFQTYYRNTKQEAAERHISGLIGDYEWDYASLAGVYVDSGEFGLQLRELLAGGRPEEVVSLLVAEADESQAEQIRLDRLAAEAEKWIGRRVASKEVMFWWDTDVHLDQLLEPRHGSEDQAQAVAWARLSGSACAVVQISGRFYVFALDRQYDRSDIFLVEQWEEARTEVVPVPSTPAGITLTTSDGYVLKAQGERFFGGTQARNPEAHLAADEAVLEQSGANLGADQAVRLFRQMTLDLLLVNLSAAEQRVRDQLSLIYGVSWDLIDTVRGLQPGAWRRTLRPKPAVGAEIQATAAALRQYMIEAADFTASVGNRDLTEDEQTEIEFTLEQIGRIYTESPLAALMVVSHRDPDATGPVEEEEFENKAAAGGPEEVADRAAEELWTVLDNIDTVRRHFLREPDAVLDLEPLHDQILDGFDAYQRFWIEWEIGWHSLSSLAKAVGMTVLQLGLVVTGMFTGGLTALAATGTATMLGVQGTVEAFESARMLSAMSKLDLKGGFQLATPEQAASARTWAYIGLALTLLDVGGFVAAGRLAARLARAAATPDVAAVLASGERDLASIARQLNMPERTLVRQLETLTGAPRQQLLARIRQILGVKIAGYAHSPKLTWLPNPVGEVRTVDEAVALARSHGVEIPGDIRFVAVRQETLPENAYAAYLQLGRKQAGDFIEWDEFYNQFEQIPVRLSADILNSDEAIVAVIGHEMHELNELRKLFAASDGRLRADQLHRAITPGYTGNLHFQAWDIADELVLKMREGQ
jgi:hypothetical protein